MISFYPGPSRLYSSIPSFMQEAAKSGILSLNHRSKEFVALSEKTIKFLKRKLQIPDDYWIFYTSSATESWEIIAQSLVVDKSLHLFNGAFGEKWFEYTHKIKPLSSAYSFDKEETLNPDRLNANDAELICLVQNETSNGTQILNHTIQSIKEKFPKQLIAVDATSSLAGIKLEISNADIWLASVQKCFGLPAGLGLLICSPKAIDKALSVNENNHYNSLPFLIEKMKVKQTSYTPNVLGIYLLMKVMSEVPAISTVTKITKERANNWYRFFESFESVQLLVENKAVRSDTVIAVMGEEDQIATIKNKAKKEGLLLGNGYGAWAKNTFRIANFPAITDKEIKLLQKFFKTHLS